MTERDKRAVEKKSDGAPRTESTERDKSFEEAEEVTWTNSRFILKSSSKFYRDMIEE